MKRAPACKRLFNDIKAIIEHSRHTIVRSVNTIIVYTYFEVGRMIVEEEQEGDERAVYAKETLKQLSVLLLKDYGKGYSEDNLARCRKFYLLYNNKISATVSRKSSTPSKKRISATLSRKFEIEKRQRLFFAKMQLGWSHYVQLIRIENEEERTFYEIEAVQNNWSVRELQRQYQASLYERLALSRDKKGVKALMKKGQIIEKPVDAIKNPFVLEFLGLEEDRCYTEDDLETAIINKLEHFMLELGKGFLFEGRQKRISFGGDHFYIDLVFYNRLLRCFVIIDLKIGKLSHQDIGQMQMYVNYYDRMVRGEEENCTIGIILCKEDNKTVVEFTLPEENNQIFSREYKLYLPSKAALKKQLV